MRNTQRDRHDRHDNNIKALINYLPDSPTLSKAIPVTSPALLHDATPGHDVDPPHGSETTVCNAVHCHTGYRKPTLVAAIKAQRAVSVLVDINARDILLEVGPVEVS